MSSPDLPDWLHQLARHLADPPAAPAAPAGRAAAVLLLFGDGPDLLLIERSRQLRAHPGQPALPGGAIEPQDDGPVVAALREAAEEVGVESDRVRILGTLPPRRISVSGYAVTPVIGYWPEPNPVRVVDPAEVAAVRRVPLAEFLDPKRRYQARHPAGGSGPAFSLDGLLVWGFTAWLIDRVLALAGWAEPLTAQTSAGFLSVGS
ncbi:MAG TPA: CoA pyrophosphatase [Mycobacteriales bacterium]|nr:CoA pyrophosphatase [Mycobacteriales bacterium]